MDMSFKDFVYDSHKLPLGVSYSSICDVSKRLGVEPERLLLSVFSLIYSCHVGEKSFALEVVTNETTPLDAHCYNINVLPDKSLGWTARSAKFCQDRGAGRGQPSVAEKLSERATFPLFCFDTGNRRPIFEEVLNARLGVFLECVEGEVYITSYVGVERSNVPSAFLFANQYSSVLKSLLDDCKSEVSVVLSRVPPLKVELNLFCHFQSETIDAALESMVAELGATLSIQHFHIGQTEVDLSSEGVPGVFRCAVVLLDADRLSGGLGFLEETVTTSSPLWDDKILHLPNNLSIMSLKDNETRLLYDEIFIERAYLNGGLSISDNDVVVDVGANIGLFSVWASSMASNVKVYAFEPAEEAFNCLVENCRRHKVDSTERGVAIGASDTTASFTFYPESTLQSGLYAEKRRDAEVAQAFAEQQIETGSRNSGELSYLAQVAEVVEARFEERQREVEVLKLSSFIEIEEISRIDFLKIDVEHAELDVLRGIEPRHWGIINQVALEVHDIEGRLAEIVDLLHAMNFELTVKQIEAFSKTDVYMVYARKRGFSARGNADSAMAEIVKRCVSKLAPDAVLAVGGSSSSDRAIRLSNTINDTSDIDLKVLPSGSVNYDPKAEQFEKDYYLALGVLRALSLQVRPLSKAIIVDADGTLWGGVCGEDGADGIVFDPHHLELMRFLKREKQNGRILFMATKNNLSDIQEVFKKHSDLPIELSDFTQIKASWGAKSNSLVALSHKFGIGLNSMVFIDDNPAECLEVGLAAPSVRTLTMPSGLSELNELISGCWELDRLPTTQEDQLRAAFYENQGERQVLRENVGSFAEFIRELRVETKIEQPNQRDVPRISQLFGRTTQFNANLRILSTSEVEQLIGSPSTCRIVSVSDRFDTYGIVGFFSAVCSGKTLVVTDFMLSCRALGRRVEWEMAKEVGRIAVSKGCQTVQFSSVLGPRNQPVRAFLGRLCEVSDLMNSGNDHALVPAQKLVKIDVNKIVEETKKPNTERTSQGRMERHTNRSKQLDWSCLETYQKKPNFEHLSKRGRFLSSAVIEPETDIEKYLASLWCEVLDIGALSTDDDLIAIGGNSFTAAKICARVAKERSWAVPINKFLQNPTIKTMARLLVHTRMPEDESFAEVIDFPRTLSLGQKRIWAAEMMSAQKGNQIIPLAFSITGPIESDRLESAFIKVIEHHTTLSTSIDIVDGEIKGVAVREPFQLERLRVSDLNSDSLPNFFSGGFNLSSEPMIKSRLISETNTDRHELQIAVHHCAADGWSIGEILSSLSIAYAEGEVGGLDVGFWHYAKEQQDRVSDGYFDEIYDKTIAPVLPELESLTSSMRAQSLNTGHYALCVDKQISDRVHLLSRKLSITDATILLAAYSLAILVSEKKRCVNIGYSVANRHNLRDQGAVGYYSNVIPIPITLNTGDTFGSFLGRVQSRLNGILIAEDLPYGYLHESWTGQSLTGYPIPFDALFTSQSIPSGALSFEGCLVSDRELNSWPAPFSLMLDVTSKEDFMQCLFRWGGETTSAAAQTLTSNFLFILSILALAPSSRISRFSGSLASSLEGVQAELQLSPEGE